MTTFDTEAQCLISDSLGQLYLCARYKRDDAEKFLNAQRDTLSNNMPQGLPKFLTAVPSLDAFHFYRAFFENGDQPGSAVSAALSNDDNFGIGEVQFMKQNKNDHKEN
jgi:hypothetical protein